MTYNRKEVVTDSASLSKNGDVTFTERDVVTNTINGDPANTKFGGFRDEEKVVIQADGLIKITHAPDIHITKKEAAAVSSAVRRAFDDGFMDKQEYAVLKELAYTIASNAYDGLSDGEKQHIVKTANATAKKETSKKSL